MEKRREMIIRIAVLGMLCALSIVLTRMLSIYITNDIRINFGNIPILIAAYWYGPAWGVLVGGASDFIGAAVFSPYGWDPLLTVTPMMIGLFSGLIFSYFKNNEINFFKTVLVVLPGNVIGCMLWTTYWLSYKYGTPFFTLAYYRVPLYIVITLAEAAAVYFIIRSKALNRLIKNQ